MRERRLVLAALVCNVVVLSLGVAAWATEAGGTPVRSVVFGGERADSAGPPASPVSGMPPPGDDAGLPAPDPSARIADVPTHELEYLPGGLLDGLLDGNADLDGGCVWIVTEDGEQAVRWPPGFQAGFVAGRDGTGAIELVDASGRVAARSGETVYFTGARSGGAERLERCHVGADHVWYVGSVTSQPPFAGDSR